MRKAAKIQITRFMRSGFIPAPSLEMQAELENAFCDLCVGEAHIAAAADWLIRNLAFFPKPKDIQDAVDALAEQSRQPKPWRPSGNPCELCGDSGWMKAWELDTYHGSVAHKTVERLTNAQHDALWPKVGYTPGKQALIECAARCTCALGQRRAAAVEVDKATERAKARA